MESTVQAEKELWDERAFRRLGGATRLVVLGNLREGVAGGDLYHPTLNPVYRDVLAHYGAIAMPCRVHDPDRKGKESGVGRAKDASERHALREPGGNTNLPGSPRPEPIWRSG